MTLTAVFGVFLKAALKVSKKCMHNIVTQTAFVLYLADPSDDSSDPSDEGKQLIYRGITPVGTYSIEID